jgi:hypothetical protein
MRAGAALLAALLVSLLLAPATASADGAMTARRISELYHAYYGMGVIDACGLDSWEVHDGYDRRIKGWIEADYQLDNHGLGGYRFWCAQDGRGAMMDFLAFRAQELGSTRN